MDRDEVMKHETYMLESIVSNHEQLVHMKLKHLVENVRENTKKYKQLSNLNQLKYCENYDLRSVTAICLVFPISQDLLYAPYTINVQHYYIWLFM